MHERQSGCKETSGRPSTVKGLTRETTRDHTELPEGDHNSLHMPAWTGPLNINDRLVGRTSGFGGLCV